MNPMNVGILLFDDVEVLDFAGPFDVFSRTRLQPGLESRRSNGTAPFNVSGVAKVKAPVCATGPCRCSKLRFCGRLICSRLWPVEPREDRA
jgi:putative intracellular protease/amidase